MKPPDVYARFPNDPCFSQLLTIAEQRRSSIIINDPGSRVKADYNRLLWDVSTVRQSLCESLPPSCVRGGSILSEDPVYVCTLLGPNYTFIVALLAILATGGAAVPLSTTLLIDEALSLIVRCKAQYVLADSENAAFAEKIQIHLQEKTGHRLHIIQIDPARNPKLISVDHKPVPMHYYTINHDIKFSPERTSLILFSSGTTGPPKAIVHNRRVFYHAHDLLPPREDGQDIFLVYRTIVSADGVLPLTRYILTGVQLEIFNQTWDAAIMWERLRKGDLTILVGAPSIWLKLMKHYNSTIVHLSEEEREFYVRGVRSLRVAVSIGASAMPDLKRFWWDLRDGRALQNSYGSTELGCSVIKSSIDEPPENFHRLILGKPKKGFDVKLSNGTHGEILVRSPFVFAGYLEGSTKVTTSSVLDKEGYFHTGDIAHMEGDDFVMDGRSEADFIKFLFEFRVPRLSVEAKISQIPRIFEAFVVPVPDPTCGERVGAIVHSKSVDIDLDELRKELSSHMPFYHLPTILYVLRGGEDVPRTRTNKLDIKKAVAKFFPSGSLCPLDSYSGNVQVYDIEKLKAMKSERPWDWAGIQR
ncbi:acetyl-CoA synthetase-like protein [Penicillium odoratum]|uniref:acetyl-CoA synthetase-like protein n=1 Tax=Penicillium odoratum TaxID=1167516 RepID=UPI002546E6F2|nr:acetyl-CoA synthetase-like protein [Penicillium odoratum]KAJ5771689.1 acetyl-CoA synthetase-like protein [Penicillium odoratum]